MKHMQNIMKKTLAVMAILFVMVFLPLAAYAQNPQGTPQGGCNPCDANGTSPTAGTICNPIGNVVCDLPTLIKTILTGVIKIGIPIIALAIVYCGFLFVSARGNAEELKKAKRALVYTLIGAAILLGSWAIAQLISDTVIKL